MKRFFLLPLLCFVVLLSCSRQDRWYKTPSSLLYKVIPAAGKDTVHMGMTVKLNILQKVGDSIMDNTYDKMPLYWMVMPHMSYYNPLEVFDYIQCVGDSIIIKQLVDSMLQKKIFTKMPPWMKKEDEWITTIKIEKVFISDSLLQADKRREQQRVDSVQKIQGVKRIEEYVQKNKIAAQKIESGIYIQLLQQGSGPVPDSGDQVGIRYRFTTLKGKLIDTNMDTLFHHPDTVSYVVGSSFMLPSVDAALRHMKQGGHAMIYIPAMQAFAGHPPQGLPLRPYEDVVAEVYLLNVAANKTVTINKKR